MAAKSSQIALQELLITRVFEASREAVWKAWTEPEMVKKWWGPELFTAPVVKIDLRVGGTYLYCMRGPDGREHWSGGRYIEIVPPERLVCTEYSSNARGDVVDPNTLGLGPDFPKEHAVTITFERVGKKTKLTVCYTPESEAVLDVMREIHMKEVWESALEKLAHNLH